MKHIKIFEDFSGFGGAMGQRPESGGKDKLVAISQEDWMYIGKASQSFIDEAQNLIEGSENFDMQEMTTVNIMEDYTGEKYLIVSGRPLSRKSVEYSDGSNTYLTLSDSEMEQGGDIYNCFPIVADGDFHGYSANGSTEVYTDQELLQILENNL